MQSIWKDEKAKVYEDFNDYCCTTLFLEKTLGATVHISEDRSAAYIELGEKVSCDESEKYELDLKPIGHRNRPRVLRVLYLLETFSQNELAKEYREAFIDDGVKKIRAYFENK